MSHSGGISRRKQLLIAGTACIGGGIQILRVLQGKGGSLAIISLFCFCVVLILSAWQLYTGSDDPDPNQL